MLLEPLPLNLMSSNDGYEFSLSEEIPGMFGPKHNRAVPGGVALERVAPFNLSIIIWGGISP